MAGRWAASVAMAQGATGGPARMPGAGGGQGGYLYRPTEIVDGGKGGQKEIPNPNLVEGESAVDIWAARASEGGWKGKYGDGGDQGVPGGSKSYNQVIKESLGTVPRQPTSYPYATMGNDIWSMPNLPAPTTANNYRNYDLNSLRQGRLDMAQPTWNPIGW
jgi:hypothetical protein